MVPNVPNFALFVISSKNWYSRFFPNFLAESSEKSGQKGVYEGVYGGYIGGQVLLNAPNFALFVISSKNWYSGFFPKFLAENFEKKVAKGGIWGVYGGYIGGSGVTPGP